jgi:hypothetical protein
MSRPLAVLALVAGCRVSYLPPASSRTDGGPVVSRGVISHEARSQVRMYKDAAGCESVQTVNRQFQLVTVQTESGPERLVLEETYDVRHCLESASSSSEATVTAWLPDSASATPRFRISGRGIAGAPVGNLYRLMATGCCGSAAVATYYSLLTGQLLFASNLPPLRIDRGPTQSPTFIGFHDTFSAVPSAEASDSRVAGVLQIGDDRHPARRLALVADSPEPFALQALTWTRGGRAVEDAVFGAPVSGTGTAVRILLRAPGSGRRLQLSVPADGDSLVIDRATLPAGLRWRR